MYETDCDMQDFGYEEWLSTHAKKKTIMEKLERSLVPFQLFSSINLEQVQVGEQQEVGYNNNTYNCRLLSKSVVNDRDVLLFEMGRVSLANEWEDVLLGYTCFKVVIFQGQIVTIYPFQEAFFDNVIGLFESQRYAELYKLKNKYIKNLLARYILVKLIHRHKPNWSLLYSVAHKGGNIPVLAGVENVEWTMYAFSKREANELAMHYKDMCRKLNVVYFINQNFEYEYRNHNYAFPNVRIVSVKEYYRAMNLGTKERMLIEKQIFFLMEMLYDNRLDWNENKLLSQISRAPRLTDKKILWLDIPKILVEDALNVLVEDYDNPKDIFHLLCAANLINTYTNRYKDSKKQALREKRKHTKVGRMEKVSLNGRVHVMYRFKNQVMETVLMLLKRKSPHLKVSLGNVLGCREYTLLIDIKMDRQVFQFKFRGIHPKYIDELQKIGVRTNAEYSLARLQPIAPALYMYSCNLRWKMNKN